MRVGFAPWVLAGALLTCGSCASEQRPLSLQPPEDINSESYEEVLQKWTRSDKVYRDGLDSILFVHATFHSPEFRKAFLLRHPDVYGRGSEAARRLALISEGAEESLEFFFSATTSEMAWNDFDKPDSIWRVTLSSDHAESVDGTVVRLRTTANLRVIYPYISDFARTYAVRFPLSTVTGEPLVAAYTKKFTLRFSSALGAANLEWDLVPLARPPVTAPLPKKE